MVYPPLIKKSYPGARTIGPNGTCVPGITFCTAPIFPFDADFDPSDVEGPPDPFDPATEKGPVFPDPPAIDPVKGFPDLPAFPVDSPVFDSYLKAFWISKISYPSDRSCVLPVKYSKKDWIFLTPYLDGNPNGGCDQRLSIGFWGPGHHPSSHCGPELHGYKIF